MSKRREKMTARLNEAVAPALEPGETPIVAVPAIGGANPWSWCWLFLAGVIPMILVFLIFVPSYILVLTDRRVVVLRGSKYRSAAAKGFLVGAPRTSVSVTKQNLSKGSAMVLRLGYVFAKLRFADGSEKRFNIPGFFGAEAATLSAGLAAQHQTELGDQTHRGGASPAG
jgi:hypothetical protein